MDLFRSCQQSLVRWAKNLHVGGVNETLNAHLHETRGISSNWRRYTKKNECIGIHGHA